MKRTTDQLIEMAKARWRGAEQASHMGAKPLMWVNLLGMGMYMAAAQKKLLDVDLEALARDGGMFP